MCVWGGVRACVRACVCVVVVIVYVVVSALRPTPLTGTHYSRLLLL